MSDVQPGPGRGRRTAVLTAAAAVAAALAIGVPVVLSGGAASGPGPGSEDQARLGTGEVPQGWRVESWGDLTWAVPDEWGYGTIDQWCADRGDGRRSRAEPVVQRPNVLSTLVGCHPARGLGLQVSVGASAPATDPEAYVEGAAVAQRRFGDATLTVSTRSSQLTERVLATARRFQGLDPHGCPATADPVAARDGGAAGAPAVGGRLSVCRYALRGPGAVLDQSELLSAADSARAWEALGSAPEGTGPDADPDSCGGWPAEQAVLLRTAAEDVAWVHHDGCSDHGVALLGEGSRRLTEEVLHWAISPGWSGGWDGSVPMPQRLREPSGAGGG